MLSVALFYLIVGHTDFLIKKLGGSRNDISASIYKTMRIVGWIMLLASILNFFYESIYWNLSFLIIGFFGIYIIRMSNKVTKHIQANDLRSRLEKELN